MYKNLLLLGVISIGGALVATEFVNFRPEISTQVTRTILNDDNPTPIIPTPTPTPNNPSPTACSYGCDKNGMIYPPDDNPPYRCPCDDQNCPCIKRKSEMMENSLIEDNLDQTVESDQPINSGNTTFVAPSNNTQYYTVPQRRGIFRIFRRRR